MQRLSDVLKERGLRMRPQANRSAGPISAKNLARVLRDRYYLGFINCKGEEYQGRHEPLVSADLFTKVQSMLDERPKEGLTAAAAYPLLEGSPVVVAGAMTGAWSPG